jgi:hypothetical protein
VIFGEDGHQARTDNGHGERREEQGSLATYRSEAAALGVPFDRVHQKINVTNELPQLNVVRGEPDFAAFLEGTWRLLSGFEHGYSWALLQGGPSVTPKPRSRAACTCT